jgi:hypothetical protein
LGKVTARGPSIFFRYIGSPLSKVGEPCGVHA